MNLSKINRLTLARMLRKFGELNTDKGVLTYEGELAVGVEIFVEVDGELVPAEGEFVSDNKTFIVEGGILKEIKETTPEPIEEPEPIETPMEEETPTPEPKPTENVEELKERISELEKENEELKTIIEEYKKKETETEGETIEEVEKKFKKEEKETENKGGLKFNKSWIK